MRSIGLFGGSFDPIHLGHLLVAQTAREELALDRLYFIPAAQSPLKPNTKPAPAHERVRMLRLALHGKDWCEVDEQEVQRGGVSFTVETLRSYHLRFPEHTIYYLIGSDNVPTLPKWRAAEELAGLATFAAVARPGSASARFPAPFKGITLTGFPLELSSSQIRARVAQGKPIDHLVPQAIAEAIRNNHLYF